MFSCFIRYQISKTGLINDTFQITTFAYKVQSYILRDRLNIKDKSPFLAYLIETAISNGKMKGQPILLIQTFWSESGHVHKFYKEISMALCGSREYASTMKIITAYGLFKFCRNLKVTNSDLTYTTWATFQHNKKFYISKVWNTQILETVDYNSCIREVMSTYSIRNEHIWALACILDIKIFIQGSINSVPSLQAISDRNTPRVYGYLFCRQKLHNRSGERKKSLFMPIKTQYPLIVMECDHTVVTSKIQSMRYEYR